MNVIIMNYWDHETGKQFNIDHRNEQFVVLINKSNINKFKTGFNYSEKHYLSKYRKSEIYFINLNKLPNYLNRIDPITHIRFVTLSNKSRIYVNEGSFKTDKCHLSETISISKLSVWKNHSYNLHACKLNHESFKYIDPDLDMVQKIIKVNGLILQFIKDQTTKMCLDAVINNGLALQYVLKQTPEICLEAVKNDGSVLVNVEIQTLEICKVAVKQNRKAIIYIKDKSMIPIIKNMLGIE